MAEDNWIGGDFTGLQHMGSTLTGATKELEGVVKPLSSGADSLVHDAGWQGDAATSFRDAWTTDAMTAGGFSDLVGSVGSILTSLGTELSQLNDALHSAAVTAKGLGVPVGPDGAPGTMVTANPPDAAAQKSIQALSDYGTVYASIKHQAQQARLQAAEALTSLHDELDPSEPLANADKAVVGIVLRDLYASRDDHKSVLAEAANEEVSDARKARAAAKTALATERASFAAEGKWLPKNLSSYTEYRSSVSEYVKAQQALGAIEDSRNAFSKLVNFKAGDVEAISKALSDFTYAPDFLKDVPVVDVAAALVGAGFEAKTDHDEGWSWTHAAVVDGGGALLGVAAGVAVVALLPEEAVGAAAVAVGATAVATCLAVGVGVDKAFHEHWSEDIHDHGILGGVAQGSWNVVKGTGSSIAEDAKGVWHGVTSIF